MGEVTFTPEIFGVQKYILVESFCCTDGIEAFDSKANKIPPITSAQRRAVELLNPSI